MDLTGVAREIGIERLEQKMVMQNDNFIDLARRRVDLARWSCFCYVLQEDSTSIPTLQKRAETVLVRPRSGRARRREPSRRR